jgi:hypothetical protein
MLHTHQFTRGGSMAAEEVNYVELFRGRLAAQVLAHRQMRRQHAASASLACCSS